MGRSIIFSLALSLGAGVTTYGIKSRVIKLENDIVSMRKQINQFEEGLHVLQAEWSYLNRPERLQALAQDKLGLIVTDHHHLVSYEREEEAFGEHFGAGDPMADSLQDEDMMPPQVHLTSAR